MPELSAVELTTLLREEAQQLGFNLAGVCPAVTPAGIDHFHRWLAAGHAGQMHYLEDRRLAYAHPQGVLAGVRSLLVLTMDYRAADPNPAPGQGRIAAYAAGEDYHDVAHRRLKALRRRHQALLPNVPVRGVIDTAPLLERDFAQLAGLGWIGKNTLLINKHRGSYFFLAVLLSGVELDYDAPHQADHCGTCTACLDACPTEAFVAAHQLDARKCISYLTIELQEAIPRELRAGIGDWVFGCDVCQSVCPWNRHNAPVSEPAEVEEPPALLDLPELFELDDEAFRARFRHTPLWRPRRRGILRNAAIVLGNCRSPAGMRALQLGLHDCEPLVRGASAWALGNYQDPQATAALRQQQAIENDPEVLAEIDAALDQQRA